MLNGAGELTGRTQIDEWGLAETPVFLTSTMQVGRVYDAACRLLIDEQPRIGVDDVVIPIVGECDDSWLERHPPHARAGRRCRGGPRRGAALDRRLPIWRRRPRRHRGRHGHVLLRLEGRHRVRVAAAAGRPRRRGDSCWPTSASGSGSTIAGVAVGRGLGPPPDATPPPAGSCIGVVITDAPIDAAGCARLAARMGLGLARTGSTAHHGSGEIFLGLATGLRTDRSTPVRSAAAISGTGPRPLLRSDRRCDRGGGDRRTAGATTTTGVGGRTIHALPHDRVRTLLGLP